MKNLLLINRYLTILLLSDTYAGSIHDKRLADAHLYPLPAGSWLLQDLGFLGFSLPNTEILAPFKKPRGNLLSLAQKSFNRQLASLRIRIEHVIRERMSQPMRAELNARCFPIADHAVVNGCGRKGFLQIAQKNSLALHHRTFRQI